MKTPWFQRLQASLQTPTDIASLVLLRVAFGLIMTWEVTRYFMYNWVEDLYIRQQFHFKYEWFQWVQEVPGNGMYWVFGAMGVSALLIALGFFYRWATLVFFLTYTYIFLIDRAYYNNHFYLIVIFGFLLLFTPLHRAWSLDVLFRREAATQRLPAFWLWTMRFPMTLAYVYGGIAKMDVDWLSGRSTLALIGKGVEGTAWEHVLHLEGVPIFYAWSGMLFDLFIPFAVLWRPTRIPAFFAALLFHTHNYFVFEIGIFPMLSLALTLLYFDPDFPRHLFPEKYKKALSEWYQVRVRQESVLRRAPQWTMGIVGAFVLFQLIFPFRHFLYPGWTLWHEEGHYFAWRMMLRQKKLEMRFDLQHPGTQEVRYAPLEEHLNPSQLRTFAGNPNMVLQFVHHLHDLVQQNAGFDPIVKGTINVSLNGRSPFPMVNPQLNLASIPNFEPAYKWVTPVLP
jgi:vitamin K-dependent gamma-carboxylase